MSAISSFNVEAGIPAQDDARRLVIAEIKQAKAGRDASAGCVSWLFYGRKDLLIGHSNTPDEFG